jgi:delta 1-pyrroline-5-carboxylate dehydrogenase
MGADRSFPKVTLAGAGFTGGGPAASSSASTARESQSRMKAYTDRQYREAQTREKMKEREAQTREKMKKQEALARSQVARRPFK